jgi:regulator of protease activity HflC (stomatin/prohibitin superfamily)
LLRFALGSPLLMAVVREGQVLPGPDGEERETAAGAGMIDVDSTSVVVLMTETGLSRIKGQGVVFTHEYESIGQVIDLRIQLRTKEFEYTTRDGIPIKVRVAVRFQIDQAQFVKVQLVDRAVRWPRPISWTPRTIKRALQLQSVAAHGITRWTDVPLDYAAGMLRAIIAEYTFDELSEPHEPRKDPRADIRHSLQQSLREALARHGINVLSASVGTFFPVKFDPDKAFNPDVKPADQLDPITQQRVKAWRAEWEGRMMRINAEGQAEAERRHDVARSQAQMELIMRVTQALEQGMSASAGSQDQIARRFLDTLQKMAQEPYTRDRLSEENLQVIRQMIATTRAAEQSEQPTES